MLLEKKISYFIVILMLLGIAYIFINPLVFEWRAKRSEERVRISIIDNYENNKSKFNELINYCKEIQFSGFLEFNEKNRISGTIHSDSFDYNKTSYIHFNGNILEDFEEEINILENGNASLTYGDTAIETSDWVWEFEGDEHDPEYASFINQLGMNKIQLDSLRSLINSVNCEAIRTVNDQLFGIRYDGFSLYEYEYTIHFDKSRIPNNYTKLDEGIACGLNDSGLFCGYIIFDK